MEKGIYIKASPFVAQILGLAEIRRKTPDGNYILWPQDVTAIEGETLEERCKFLGAVIIDTKCCKTELSGKEEPVPVMEESEDDLPDNFIEELDNNLENDLDADQETDPEAEEEQTAENAGETIQDPEEETIIKERRKRK